MESKQAARGQQWLQDLLRFAGVNTTVSLQVTTVTGEESHWLVIDPAQLSSEQTSALTGPNGTVLDSIQYLTNAILNLGQPEANQGGFTVELNGYRLRRYAELKAMADQAAAAVRATGEAYELKSLSAAERRQVHTILKEFKDLATFSRGQEPDRRLVISRSKPESESITLG